MKNRLLHILQCCNIHLILLLAMVAFSAQRAAGQTVDFTADKYAGCVPLTVSFTNQSDAGAVSYNWDFGLGANVPEKDPGKIFTTAGTYNVKLTVTYPGNVVKSVTKQITVYNLPNPLFTASPLAGCSPLNVTFTDKSTPGSGTITRVLWDFGDGVTSPATNPTHTYTLAGNFTVGNIVTNSFGCTAGYTLPTQVKVQSTPVANFSANQTNSCITPFAVNFTSTAPAGVAYSWNFGDAASGAANTSTQANPTHTYNAEGSYTVTLTVTTSEGCAAVVTKSNFIVVRKTVPNFTTSTACAGGDILFTNTTTPTPTVYTWTFPDGTSQTTLNANKTFAVAGDYQVTLTSGTPGCMETVTKTVRVYPKPTASFTANPQTGCSVPFTTQFTSGATGATQYRWNFGDGSAEGTTAHPPHTYTVEGDYDVSLWVRNANGCADSITREDYIRVHKPEIVITAMPPEGCIPFTTRFTPYVSTGGPVTAYYWDFGDGTTSTASTPAHTYTTEGAFLVKLRVTLAGGCIDSATIPVRAGEIPIVNFDANPKLTCARFPVQFTNLSVPRGTSWSWVLPQDNTILSQENPNHVFNNEGQHDVTLIVNNYGCIRSLTKLQFISIQPPIASFTALLNCTDKMQAQFLDRSDFGENPTVKNWRWDFGDGQTSTQQSPIHRYADTGVYRVTLTVDNSACEHTLIQTVHIIDEKPQIQADKPVICPGDNIQFSRSNTNDNNIRYYSWNWGDNSTSQVSAVTWNKRYTQPGTYRAQLSIVDLNYCTSVSNVIITTVNGATPEFTFSGRNCDGDEQKFTDNSTATHGNAITQWIFDYGDNTKPDTFTTKPVNIGHKFVNMGNYAVKLTVKDVTGCITSVTHDVAVLGVKAAIGRNAAVTCLNSPMGFNSTSSTGGPLTYLWDFGDGTTSTEAHPGKTFTTPGLFTISLTVSNAAGCTDTQREEDYILVPNPKAKFSMPATLANCPPVLVQLTNESTGHTRVIWDFGDGSRSVENNPSHVYNLPGTYIIRLYAYAEGDCVDSTSQRVLIQGPRGTRTITDKTGCAPHVVNFSAQSANAVKYIWDYDDGQVQTTTTPVSTHEYSRDGLYYPRVVLEDAQGCQVAAQGPLDTVVVEKVNASFIATPSVICDMGLLKVADLSTGVTKDLLNKPFTYAWDFGVPGRTDDVASTANATWDYTRYGHYDVKLTVTSVYGCTDDTTISIRVDERPDATISSLTSVCPGDTVRFVGNDAKALPNTSWKWQYGNKEYTDVNSISLDFPTPGSYDIKLFVTNEEGTCIDTSIVNLRVNPKPSLVATPEQTNVCRGESVQLQANVPGSNVVWTNYRISDPSSQSPVVSPLTDTLYRVVATNQWGCISDDAVRVTVTQPHSIATGNTAICVGKIAQLNVTGNATRYAWLPSPTLNRTDVTSPIASPSVTTTYAVVGYGKDACFTDTAYATVTVYPTPVVGTGGDRTVPSGSEVPLNIQSSPDIITWKWWPLKYLDCYDCPQPVSNPRENITYNVTATNVYGCTVTEQIAIRLQCVNSVTFIPNSFSPNGDGQNDIFYIRGRGVKSVRTFRIFNRWGELVFERVNFNVDDMAYGWDGKQAGKLLNPDVYVYYVQAVCDNNEPLLLSGNVTLLR